MDDCKTVIIYFHGNSEDVCGPMEMLKKMNRKLGTHSCIVEYPGYGIFYQNKESPINPQKMKEDGEVVYDFLTNQMGFEHKNVIVMGRSIGTGPAIYLASVKKQIKMLSLISPYTSVEDLVVENAMGLSFFIKTREIKNDFRNKDIINKIECPIVMIHGKRDRLIKPYHSEQLRRKAIINNHVYLHKPDKMTHNDFDINNDIIKPIEYLKNQLDNNQFDNNLSLIHI